MTAPGAFFRDDIRGQYSSWSRPPGAGSTPDSSYDPPSQDIPLLPNRPSRGSHRPASLAVPQYEPLVGRSDGFNPQDLYLSSSGKQNPLSPAQYDTPLKTPLSDLFPSRPRSPREHPFAGGFEVPEWKVILFHVAFCAISYPVLLVFVLVADNMTLFWSRLLVGMGCGAVGVALGIMLARLGQRFLEAATWATLIHQSRISSEPGIPLVDLAASSQYPTSIWNAMGLLWNRAFYPGTAHQARKSYDSRPWSLVALFFLLLLAIAGSLPFILGRVVDIQASIRHQSHTYREVAVFGDLSDSDIQRATALEPAFNDFDLTWTLSPFSSHGAIPPAVSFMYENDSIYFSETSRSQFLSNGSGFGTFEVNTTAAAIESDKFGQVTDLGASTEAGVLLRYPRWGIRIHCEKFTDPNTIIPRSASNFTYIFTPHTILRSLFASFNMDLPSNLKVPLNTTSALQGNDTLPTALNPSDLALSAFFSDNGVAHSFKSMPVSMGEDGKGFISIETLLVRLNTTYTPSGTFLTYSIPVPDINGKDTFIGLDAAVCLELYEPWVVETYNTSFGVPATTRIINKGNVITDVNTPQFIDTNVGPTLADPDLKRQLNSTGLSAVYDVAHGNSVNQILKDNGRDAYYVPSPTLVSFTGGQGPQGYLELSAAFFAQARAMADASNVLPYFAGSGRTVARCYADDILSVTQLKTRDTVMVIVVVLVLGLAAGLFVPRLPLDVPRRGFELYSWIAAFYSRELIVDKIDLSDQRGTMMKNLELSEIKKRMGNLKFRYDG
ncbi:hypothetical protein C8J57DRAFT_1367999 [Mycena rebaudengoi]|nr:hypothetical protein C8J57DRAFT_1367999 [Mycena rebaudengoi]